MGLNNRTIGLKNVSQKTLLNDYDAAKLKTGGTGLHVDCNESISEALTNYDEVYYNKDQPGFEEYGTAYYHNVTDKMFILGLKQVKSGNGTFGSPFVVTGNAPVVTKPAAPIVTIPAIPTKFNVVSKGQTMTLTWDKTATADYYYIYYKKANGAYTKEKVTTNTKVYTNLTKSTKFTYKVTAVNSAGEGKPTGELWKVTSK